MPVSNLVQKNPSKNKLLQKSNHSVPSACWCYSASRTKKKMIDQIFKFRRMAWFTPLALLLWFMGPLMMYLYPDERAYWKKLFTFNLIATFVVMVTLIVRHGLTS